MSESGRSGGATWGRAGVVGLLALALLLADWPIGALAQGATCSSFPNQAAAQAALRANPVAMGGLDRDRDGVACESLSCPCDGVATTARAGATRSSGGGASATGTPSTAFIFTAPTLPPQPSSVVPPTMRAIVRPTGIAAATPPLLATGLSGALPAAPPRDSTSPADEPPAPTTAPLTTATAAATPGTVPASPAALGTVSPTPSAGATPAASFGDLADTWAGRAGLLIIHADGRARALWPVGQVCGDAASGPCDASATELGGRATLALRWREDAMVVAEVADSSQESALPLGVAILRLRPDGVLELWPAAAAEAPRAYCNERLRQERPALVREWCSAATP